MIPHRPQHRKPVTLAARTMGTYVRVVGGGSGDGGGDDPLGAIVGPWWVAGRSPLGDGPGRVGLADRPGRVRPGSGVGGRWQLSCAEWLMLRTGMARATAFEKLRIAHQLRARPIVAAAFADGRLSYSAVRAITHAEDPDADTDAALVDLAVAGTVADVERAVRCYQLHADQHRAPCDAWERRGVRIIRGWDGTGRVEIPLTAIEIEEFAAALRAFVDLGARCPVDESSAEDSRTDPVDESSAEDSLSGPDLRSNPVRRADAFMDLIRVALAHADDGHAAGADRYLVHVVTQDGSPGLADGTPLDADTAAVIACDSSTVAHVIGEDGETLALGRKTRVWSTAQRRAALVRDGGSCRFPDCDRRIADLHHQQPWTSGGRTDLDNGFLVCRRHHTLLHRGYQVTGNPNRTLTFLRPDGTPIGTTTPVSR